VGNTGSLPRGAGASDSDLNSPRLRIEKDMIDKTRRALMQFKSDRNLPKPSNKTFFHSRTEKRLSSPARVRIPDQYMARTTTAIADTERPLQFASW
jgi:hypothetical protein